MHNGIFVDVISHDATADHRIAQKLHIFATRGIRALVFNKWAHSSVREEKHSKIGVLILNGLKELLPMSFLETIQEKLLTLFSRKKHPHYLYDSMGRNINRGAFPASWLDEVIEVEFEGHMLPIPKEYDKYLTWLYGDYMQMIPVSKRRISHSILWMDLGEYEYFQIDNSFSTKNN
jgi:lipopolysaccharide cholinephosphotransferase